MARTISNIQQQILTEKNNQPALSGLTSTSQVSIYNLWSFVTATSINFFEMLWDSFQAQLETTIINAPIGTDSWLRNQTLQFQYDATTPQIVTLTTAFTPTYPVVDTTKQIITQASVKTLPSRIINVKVAKSNPPVALASQELSSLQGFLDTIGFAGTQINAKSYNSDKVMVGATIYYNGQYAATITATTQTAINNYLYSLPFDGKIKLSALEDAIQAIPGVNDVVLNNVAIRPDATAFSATTYMVQNNTELLRTQQLYGGYCVAETTTNYTLNDTLVFVVG